MTWDTVIGLEVHAQLKTKAKLFSNAPTHFGAAANSQTSFIDAGLPGTLPVLNQEAVKLALRFGIAIDAKINDYSFFERKNYFYPDLPKGYQISQFQRPIIGKGSLEIIKANGERKAIEIVRAHLEEDAGKSLHENHSDFSGIDLNRAGTPLLEIVTAPCLSSAEEAVAYLKNLHQLLKFLDICDGNMQEGSFRCDVNLSIKQRGESKLGTRVEIKNLNSFRFIEQAIAYEVERQIDCLESGEKLIQETRLYSPNQNKTIPMRSKESENDYRYFPDPDLLPIKISEKLLADIRNTMPASPKDLRIELTENYAFSEDELGFLLTEPACLQYFKACAEQAIVPAKLILNWMKGNLSAVLNDAGLSFDNNPIAAHDFTALLEKLAAENLSAKSAKTVLQKLMLGKQNLHEIIATEGLADALDEDALKAIVQKIVEQHPLQIAELRAGKEKIMGFIIGLIMKETKGKANPATITELLKQQIKMA